MSDDILAEVSASVPRRAIGVGTLFGLGGLLIYVAMSTPPALVWQLFLIALGLASIWAGQMMLRATRLTIRLTREGLFDSEGTVLAPMENIDRVDRSMFANKPSNGFMVILKEPAPRGWRLGMWWRLGRRLAIGGVTPGAQTKPMADIMMAIKAGHV
ncbi:hypothetical protein [Aestuariicoccus sp. MJ-SS9]|uniref:hypothetical protein n=1 Tax=Aestuariicoccus sp. MJ-SS9 TaxID=3079855 RepID=UPI0029067D31|nr:hypothetical protein [Aestuariicoccus sp. MJ-SS9]MDU8911229.1 hypothetical protein [Aestuariicoccus sp. MJ-SS9]